MATTKGVATLPAVIFISCRMLAIVCFALWPGCAFFHGKPPLPRRGAIENAERPKAPDDFEDLVARADIIYLPIERLGVSSASEPAWKLIESFRRGGVSFALGWGVVDGEDQGFFDQWEQKQVSTDNLVARLNFIGPGREREQCRDFLRDSRASGFRHLALHCPRDLLGRIRSGETLSARDREQLPRGFKVRKEDAANFSQQFSSTRALSEQEAEALYRMYLANGQFAAERIVQHVQERGGKLLVFLSRRYLDSAHGVPAFVAQKLPLRQIILDAGQATQTRADLVLIPSDRCLGWQFQVVNRAPFARGY